MEAKLAETALAYGSVCADPPSTLKTTVPVGVAVALPRL